MVKIVCTAILAPSKAIICDTDNKISLGDKIWQIPRFIVKQASKHSLSKHSNNEGDTVSFQEARIKDSFIGSARFGYKNYSTKEAIVLLQLHIKRHLC